MKLTGDQIREIEISEFNGVPSYLRVQRPFYWSRCGKDSAPSGWYQWTDSGLVYLGESILERA